MLTKVFPSPGGVNFGSNIGDTIGNKSGTCLSVNTWVVPPKLPCKPKYYTTGTLENKGIHPTIWHTILETKVYTHALFWKHRF